MTEPSSHSVRSDFPVPAWFGGRIAVFFAGILCGAVLPILLHYTGDPQFALGMKQPLQSGFTPPTAAAPVAFPSPAAPAHDGSQCDLCADDYLFLLSPGGRSGSTTTLQMVNEIPGFDIKGENNGIVGTLRKAVSSLNRTYDDRSYAWLHPTKDLVQLRANALCKMQDIVKTVVLGIDANVPGRSKTIGFKEIRHKSMEDLHFFRDLFPCARYVLTTRQTATLQYNSQKKQHWNPNLKRIQQSRKNFQTFASILGPQLVYTLVLETFSAERFNGMLTWLGVTGCKFTSVFHANSDHGYGVQERKTVMQGTCAYAPPNS